jgi:hypothetical protein
MRLYKAPTDITIKAMTTDLATLTILQPADSSIYRLADTTVAVGINNGVLFQATSELGTSIVARTLWGKPQYDSPNFVEQIMPLCALLQHIDPAAGVVITMGEVDQLVIRQEQKADLMAAGSHLDWCLVLLRAVAYLRIIVLPSRIKV